EVPRIIDANLEGVKAFMARTKGPGLAVHVTDAATGKPLAAQAWLPHVETEMVDRHHADATFGHLWRLLSPGRYDLIISCGGYETAVRNLAVGAGEWTPVEVQLRPIPAGAK